MLKEKIAEMETEIEEKRSAINTKIDEAKAKVAAEDLEGAKELRSAIDTEKTEVRSLEEKIKEYKEIAGLDKEETRSAKGGKKDLKKVDDEELNVRDGINDYIRSKGSNRDGVTSVDVDAIIPKDIVYSSRDEIKTVTDLRQFVNVVPVTTASGTYPVLAKVDDVFPTVAELEKNPELAKPQFTNVDWKIATRRGALSVSQESIDDSQVDLTGIIADQLRQRDINTSNAGIAAVIKNATAKTISTVDDIKKIINVDLDPAYNKVIVASQSFYNELDTLKDNNGKYLLQSDITSPTGYKVLGVVIIPIADTLLGTQGQAKAFIGDLKRAVTFFDRAQLSVKWVDHSIYGQYLTGVLRFDVKATDTKAGYFVTYTAPVGE